MTFENVEQAFDACKVMVHLLSTRADAAIEYPFALSAYGKHGLVESFDPDQREIKFKDGVDVYFLSESELQDWCIDRTYWLNGRLYKSCDMIFDPEE